MVSLGRLTGIVCILAAALLLPGFLPSPVSPALANTGCPAASISFGSVTWTSSCVIDTDTTWGNGTLTLAGSLTVNAGSTLLLWNMTIAFSSTSNLQRNFGVDGTLVMEYGTLRSADSYRWYMTSSGTSARVAVSHANITGAGSGSTFGIAVSGGGRNRFAYDTILGVNMQVLGDRGDYVGYSNISNFDDSILNQHMIWVGPNSTFEHNTMWDITLGTQSAIMHYRSYGNVTFFANNLFLHANGANSMGFEVIDDQAAQVPVIYPGTWVARLTWNNVTWLSTASGSNSHAFDNEFSERVWIANNTVTVLPPGGSTECLQAGGMTNSLVEHNVCRGPFAYGIYDYIYSNADNTFRYNTFDRAQTGVIVQAGGNTFAHNRFTNLTGPGLFLCPNSSCAGSTANTSNNAWYNNTLTFATGNDLTRMSLTNAFYNVVLGHGAKYWTDGTTQHPINGDWLFFANAPIQRLVIADSPAGHRTLYVTAAGQTYWDQQARPNVTDSASMTIEGTIDRTGSVQGGTVFSSFTPRGTSSFDVRATGIVTIGLQGFVPSYTYNVTVENLATSGVQTLKVPVNTTGAANFSWNAGATTTSFAVAIGGSFPSPPGDTTPPAQVTDLQVTQVGSTYAILEWTAPGNNGTTGQASEYDLRYSTTGPLTNATFSQGVQVPTPLPGIAGTVQTANASGLQPATFYWFALRTADSVPNWSPISDLATINTLPTYIPNGSTPAPHVVAAWANVTLPTVDIVFSEPMNRSSVVAVLQVTPDTAYHAEWLNDSHLRITFEGPLLPATQYAVTIGASALDQGGDPLEVGYRYAFTSPASTSSVPSSPIPWAWPALVAVVVIIVALGLLAWTGRMPAIGRRIRSLGRWLRRRGKSEESGREGNRPPPQ